MAAVRGPSMNLRDAFLEDVLARPEDPAVKLVFADWLEDNGRPDLAHAYRWMARRGYRPGQRQRPLARKPWAWWHPRSIDVFHSSADTVILGLGMRIVGTAEHGCRTAAGQCGFTPIISCPADALLYSRLRQHPWDPVVQWSGNDGGHYGSNRPGFLRAYVLPLLADP